LGEKANFDEVAIGEKIWGSCRTTSEEIKISEYFDSRPAVIFKFQGTLIPGSAIWSRCFGHFAQNIPRTRAVFVQYAQADRFHN
jgi:hypothetical protein